MIRFHLTELILKKSVEVGRRIDIGEISEQTGIHRSTGSRVLNQPGANLTADNMSRLCKFFGCTLGELAEYVDDEATTRPSSSKQASKAKPGAGERRARR